MLVHFPSWSSSGEMENNITGLPISFPDQKLPGLGNRLAVLTLCSLPTPGEAMEASFKVLLIGKVSLLI